ncbi:hypothetical protein [Chryseobacterium sp. SC28]|uniref:hypothetical protein n=1 Tax=Chryseobacterium sp. SC28 TaxID=2268028 RepID=UPI000F65016F|nr:hypothetical protein [Chryseobacterium sp. SC28]RRQ45318.1 hypothetical protein DTW91_11060 [Chryseobacterium sp. SC28]
MVALVKCRPHRDLGIKTDIETDIEKRNEMCESLVPVSEILKILTSWFRNCPQEEIPIDSACSNCNEYDACRNLNKICWRDEIKAYGNDKWYFPDVACPKAPPLKYHIE